MKLFQSPFLCEGSDEIPFVISINSYSYDWIVRPSAFACERENVEKTRLFHDDLEGEWRGTATSKGNDGGDRNVRMVEIKEDDSDVRIVRSAVMDWFVFD